MRVSYQGAGASDCRFPGVDTAGLRGYHLLPAARADFLRRLGRRGEAAAEYRQALTLAGNPRERQFYSARLAACKAGGEVRPVP
jgi:RNA polymerase sigma-70 factor (ECF subfamily)